LIGGAIGDALGWPIEFMSLEQITTHHGPQGVTGFVGALPAQITDDTQMTLFTADGILRTAEGDDPTPALRESYLRWLTTQREQAPALRTDGWLMSLPFLYASRSPGNACTSGLAQQQAAYLPPADFGAAGPINPSSKGCGTVMRSAPFGLFRWGPQRAFVTAARAAQLTHGHPTGYLAAGAFAAIIERVVAGVDLPNSLRDTVDQLQSLPAAGETIAAIRRAYDAAASGPPSAQTLEQVGAGWVAEECLAIAVYVALHAYVTGNIAAALLLSVNHTGDSDSTGAVCGNLLGAMYGIDALPPAWTGGVEGSAEIIGLADDIVDRAAPKHRKDIQRRYPPR
jgi:ADP-ribosylglycohydrolase